MTNEVEIVVPDIGGATGVAVIECSVAVGDHITEETAIVTLESDKASMEIPAGKSGKVLALLVKVGDLVSQGDALLRIESDAVSETPAQSDKTEAPKETAEAPSKETQKTAPAQDAPEERKSTPQPEPVALADDSSVQAGPLARRLARELGVSLAAVTGSGRQGRVIKEDVVAYVKSRMSAGPSSSALPLNFAMPVIDFSAFGEIESKPLNKIKRLTAQNVHRSWVTIPQVTHFDEADITDLEDFRVLQTAHSPVKLTVLAFVTKAVSQALIAFPAFNASLDATGENLIYKHYINVGIAVETPDGLMVPVIKDVGSLSINEIAAEMARLSLAAREKKLMPPEMRGGCFTISSLGGIGGRAFTPIVNGPEVAILGLSRAHVAPVYQGGQFVPRRMLPLSLSYDHRVIDGAEAARFSAFLVDKLSDVRRMLL